jgi:hypothetical protein
MMPMYFWPFIAFYVLVCMCAMAMSTDNYPYMKTWHVILAILISPVAVPASILYRWM